LTADSNDFSFLGWIIAILPLSPLLKVNILATTSLEKRLRAIEKTLNVDIAAQQKKGLCLMSGCENLMIDECCENERSRQQNLL
jgi:chorismate-pyruvate lyase